MRRREKFVISAILLSVGLLGVQYVPLEFRYYAVSLHSLLAFLVSGWALSDDLQRYELATIVPMPALYTAAVGLFYFLLPSSMLTRLFILILFGVGMYAIYLVSNIFSVAKGRTIQLLHAAHAISALMTLITSLLFLNTIFSLRLWFWMNGILVFVSHFPLIFLSLWSIDLKPRIEKEVLYLALLLTLLLSELAIVFSFLPLNVWHSALFIMAMLYVGLGVIQSYQRGRLFSNTITEYSLVGAFIVLVFIWLFPGK